EEALRPESKVLPNRGVVCLVIPYDLLPVERASLCACRDLQESPEPPVIDHRERLDQRLFRREVGAEESGDERRPRAVPLLGVLTERQHELASGERRVERLIREREIEGDVLECIGALAQLDE